MLVAKSPLQGVTGYLSVLYFGESWGTEAEESYTQRNVAVHFQGVMGFTYLLVLTTPISMYLNMEYSQVSCADEINILKAYCIFFAWHE